MLNSHRQKVNMHPIDGWQFVLLQYLHKVLKLSGLEGRCITRKEGWLTL